MIVGRNSLYSVSMIIFAVVFVMLFKSYVIIPTLSVVEKMIDQDAINVNDVNKYVRYRSPMRTDCLATDKFCTKDDDCNQDCAYIPHDTFTWGYFCDAKDQRCKSASLKKTSTEIPVCDNDKGIYAQLVYDKTFDVVSWRCLSMYKSLVNDDGTVASSGVCVGGTLTLRISDHSPVPHDCVCDATRRLIYDTQHPSVGRCIRKPQLYSSMDIVEL